MNEQIYLTIETIERDLGEVMFHTSLEAAAAHANELLAEVVGCEVNEFPEEYSDQMALIEDGRLVQEAWGETANHDDWDCHIAEAKPEENFTLRYFQSFAPSAPIN